MEQSLTTNIKTSLRIYGLVLLPDSPDSKIPHDRTENALFLHPERPRHHANPAAAAPRVDCGTSLRSRGHPCQLNTAASPPCHACRRAIALLQQLNPAGVSAGQHQVAAATPCSVGRGVRQKKPPHALEFLHQNGLCVEILLWGFRTPRSTVWVKRARRILFGYPVH